MKITYAKNQIYKYTIFENSYIYIYREREREREMKYKQIQRFYHKVGTSQTLQNLAGETIRNPSHQLLLGRNHSQLELVTPPKIINMLASTPTSPQHIHQTCITQNSPHQHYLLPQVLRTLPMLHHTNKWQDKSSASLQIYMSIIGFKSSNPRSSPIASTQAPKPS